MEYLVSIRSEDGDWSRHPAVKSAARDAHAPQVPSSGKLQFFAGLHSVWTSTVVDGRGARPVLHDRPFSSADGRLAAFWVVEATDLDEAIRWAQECSATYRRALEVRPLIGSIGPRSAAHCDS